MGSPWASSRPSPPSRFPAPPPRPPRRPRRRSSNSRRTPPFPDKMKQNNLHHYHFSTKHRKTRNSWSGNDVLSALRTPTLFAYFVVHYVNYEEGQKIPGLSDEGKYL